MAAVVIDASIASAWCFPDEQTDYTRAVFQAVSSSAVDSVAPRLWAYEIRNSVLMGIRRGRISKPDSEQFLVSLNELNVHLSEPASYDDVFSLAQEHGLTVYDAAYLDLAIRERLPLASLDGQLVRAAQKVESSFSSLELCSLDRPNR
jgi:predicted nucleic acid-binding protein